MHNPQELHAKEFLYSFIVLECAKGGDYRRKNTREKTYLVHVFLCWV